MKFEDDSNVTEEIQEEDKQINNYENEFLLLRD